MVLVTLLREVRSTPPTTPLIVTIKMVVSPDYPFTVTTVVVTRTTRLGIVTRSTPTTWVTPNVKTIDTHSCYESCHTSYPTRHVLSPYTLVSRLITLRNLLTWFWRFRLPTNPYSDLDTLLVCIFDSVTLVSCITRPIKNKNITKYKIKQRVENSEVE